MNKFKVGDKVRSLLGDGRIIEIGKNGGMDYFVYGETMDGHDCSRYDMPGHHYCWLTEGDIELIKPLREFIVLRRDGADVIASHKRGDEIVKTAKATCNEKDTFDFMVGAGIAFDKLAGRYVAPPKEPKPEKETLFSVGDRVVTSRGAGIVKEVDKNSKKMPYLILYDNGEKHWVWSDEAKPEPKPAHRFKVGDRVSEVRAGYGIGEVVEVDADNKTVPYRVKFDRSIFVWLNENRLSPAPAPKAEPKMYTGKVKLVRSCGCYECDQIVGKVFDVLDGRFTGFIGAWGQPFSSFPDFLSKRHNKNWIEVKE